MENNLLLFLFILNRPVFVIAKGNDQLRRTYKRFVCVCILLQLIWLHYPITWTDFFARLCAALGDVSYSAFHLHTSIMWFQLSVTTRGVFNKFIQTQEIITPEYEPQRHRHIWMNSHTSTFGLLSASSWFYSSASKQKCVIESAFGSEIQNCNYPCVMNTRRKLIKSTKRLDLHARCMRHYLGIGFEVSHGFQSIPIMDIEFTLIPKQIAPSFPYISHHIFRRLTHITL